jgi:hypothetical protein
MAEHEESKPEDIEKPVKVIDEIVDCLSDMHQSLVEGATSVGYAIDAFREIRPTWVKIEEAEIADPMALRVYTSGSQFWSAFRDEVLERRRLVEQIPDAFDQLLGTVATGVKATGTTASYLQNISFEPTSNNVINIVTPNRHKEYAERFARFDLELGQTYKGIWEVLYGIDSGSERGALFLIRQAFDHLVSKLAPDDEVRSSQFWTKKLKGDGNQVWREERILFAASKHIKDQARARTLAASAKHMLDVYKALNKAHHRGKLDRMKARKALSEMQSILEEWADALEI